MNNSVIFKVCSYCLFAITLAGCFGSGVKTEPGVCELLRENDQWAEPLVLAQEKYGTPLYLTLVLLNQPLSDLDKRHINPRTADWDEYRLRSENWEAAISSPYDAVDFIGWFTLESVKRNQLDWSDVSAHYLSYRMGHGAYHRFEPEKYPELVVKSEQVSQRAELWRKQLKSCQLQSQEKSWYSKLKFW